jgi:hypothetical protein
MATLLFHARLLFDRTTILVCVSKHDGANTSCVRFSSSSTRWWSPSHCAPQNSGGFASSMFSATVVVPKNPFLAAINDSPPIATAATATREKETIFRIVSFLCLPLATLLGN